MFSIQLLLFLLSASLNEMNVLQSNYIQINSSFERIGNYSEEISNGNSSIPLPETEPVDIVQPDAVYDNNYSQKLSEPVTNTTEEFPSEPLFEASWTFCGPEEVRAVFSLFDLAKPSDQQKFSDHNQRKLSSTMVSLPSRSLHSLHLLKYHLFTIRQHKTNTIKILQMHQLFLKTSPIRRHEHLSNSLLLIRLNPKEKYSVCIYYYQTNISIARPDLFICQDIMHDHLKHPVHGLFFILTQYSIILGILVILQGLFSMRKRRIPQIIHQHLVDKTQRIRSTLSSVSLIRQSFSSMDAPIEPQHHDTKIEQENQLKKRFTSSPAIILNQPSTSRSTDEHEPFLKLIANKNHVHFFFGLDEGSDDNESNDTPLEPYSDRSDALSSMAHILESNKPWSKHPHQPIPIELSH